MTKRKKIIIALCIIIPLFIILSYCIYVAADLLSGFADKPVMVATEDDIKAFLDENDFSYTMDYTEEEGKVYTIQRAEYVITAGETSATLIVRNESDCVLTLTITDPVKDFDQKIYTVLSLMNELIRDSDYYDIENMTKDEYLYSQTDEVTVYRRDWSPSWPEYYYEVTLSENSYEIYIFDQVAEDYYYVPSK